MLGQIQDLILQKETGNSNAKLTTNVTPFPNSYHEGIPNVSELVQLAPITIDYPIMILMCILVYRMIEEKEYKNKEFMKILGMSETSYNMSWIVFYNLVWLFISFYFSIILKDAIFKLSNFLLIWAWLYVLFLTIHAKAIIVTTLVNKGYQGVVLMFALSFIQENIIWNMTNDFGNVSYFKNFFNS